MLVVARSLLLIGVRTNQCRVNIKDQLLRASTQPERLLSRHLAGSTHAFELLWPDPLYQPESGRV
jgi:hypothetical protein